MLAPAAHCSEATHELTKHTSWLSLPLLGVQTYEVDGERWALTLKNCPLCNSTLAVEIAVAP